MYRLLLACEGPTDQVVVEAAVANHIDDFVTTRLQPESDNLNDMGPYGGGWKGVRSWCEQLKSQGGIQSLMKPGDVLVIHVDADIASDEEVACERLCPPPSATVDQIRNVVLRNWLGEDRLSQASVLCIPSKATEAWVFVGLYSDDLLVDGIECRPEPASLLVGMKPKLVSKKDGRYRKNTQAYKNISGRLEEQWKTIVNKCSEAARFDTELASAIASLPKS